ncbi:LemA protein [Chitinophaga ginsengisegetis]|jgi:LemA protein|uniref:LemA protein n=2 Tax=Chitinophaga TaxID=79328 RepID=A0A1T5PCL5_9BACT|nr:LemA family protein [Chitinophaga ginsengisegetis]MDR6570147.1 LemA protein [Chitinophaga ginsengisegetis]MDR6649881.1 LemA protein [Chitinophaga ginsengisegetis]MDR6656478.1 LemA protein [Chitinophaga ginsengisegetis]SKD10475.1 LemA protein [Chitinophaga ginsengisegetis]
MKTGIIVIVVLALLVMLGCGKYNGLVTKDENVKNKWGVVQSSYQRRADLIPNLVATVKGAANFETETLEKVIQARASATQIKVDVNDLSPEKIQQYQAAQGQLSQALGRLLAVSEAYPDLKANANFQNLQAQLEGTENRINVARNDFNEAVNAYNSSVRTFPNNIVAGITGFKQKGYFEAAAGSENAPQVKF